MTIRSSFVFLCTLALVAQTLPESYVIRPVAGAGRGDSGPATEAVLDGPYGLAEDAEGNVYVSEANAGVIRRIRPDGIIERFAGSGAVGDGREGLPALETDLTSPAHLLIDRDGGLILADIQTCRIRKVKRDGTIQDLVGTGSCTAGGFGPGGGGNRTLPGPETQVSGIGGLALDSSGRLVFTEEENGKVRRLDSDGYVRTIAGAGGAGYSGDDGDATSAYFRYPAGLAYDSRGNLYVGDGTNCVVRRIDTAGIIETFAGTGTCTTSASFSAGGLIRRLGRIGALAYDAGSDSLFISCPALFRVIRIDLSQSRMMPFAGSGQLGTTESSDPLALTLNESSAVLTSARGVFVAANTSFQVYLVKDGAAQRFAGRWPQLAEYPSALSAPLVRPSGLSVAPDGSVSIADAGAERVLRYQGPDRLSALAGSRHASGYSLGDNGPALDAALKQPKRAVRGPGGELYVAQSSSIRVVDGNGVIKTLINYLDDPAGMVFDSEGRLIYSEAGAHQVVRYDLSKKTKTVIAGTGTAGFSGDGGAATDALLNSPGDLAFDSQGNLLVADRGNRRARRVSSDGLIQTVVGSARGASYSDITGELATDVGVGTINGMTVDQAGNIYIAEPLRISVVSAEGRARVVAGLLNEDDNGVRSYLGQRIVGTDGLAVGPDGRVYFSLPQDGRVMVAVPAGSDSGDPPSISPGGVISASGFGAFTAIAPGSWFEIYGSHLASSAREWSLADFSGMNAPTSIAGTSVTIGGKAAFIEYVSPSQVNAQAPSDVPTGAQQITVTTAAGTSAPYTITVNPAQPGLWAPPSFKIDDKQYVGALFSDGATFVLPSGAVPGTASRPARSGETIVIYGVGFGPVTPGTDAGRMVQEMNTLASPMRIFFGQAEATVAYAGLAPGAVGLYQFNVVAPSVTSSSDTLPVTFTLGGAAGKQALYTAVQQ